jgi:predicted dehydrogenase
MRVGVVGSDSIHAFQYASVVNAPVSDASPVPLVTHDIEHQAGGAAVVRPVNFVAFEAERLTGAQVRNDPDLADLQVTCWWSPDRQGAEEFAHRLNIDTVADTLEEMVDQVDLALVCSLHGEDHYAQAMPFLKAGKSVFVDKPLCHSREDAQRLVDVASDNGAVVWSSSPWRWSPVIQHLKSQLPTLGAIRSAVCSAPAHDGRYFYTVHSVELIQELFGGKPSWAAAQDTGTNYAVTIGYDADRVAIINGLRDTHWMRQVTVFGDRGYLEAEVTNEQRDEGMARMLTSILKHLRNGRWPGPPESLVEVVAVMDAASRAADAMDRVPI